MLVTPDLRRVQHLFSDRSWGPPGTCSVASDDIDYGVCELDLLDLNQVTRVRPGADGGAALVEEVDRAHVGRRSRWQLPASEVGDSLHAHLEARGYRVRLARALVWQGEPVAPAPEVEVVSDVAGLRDWHAVRVACHRTSHVPDEDALRRELAVGPRLVHMLLRLDGRPVSAGGLVLWPDARAALLWGGGTVPGQERRGAYQGLVRARLRWLLERGYAEAWTIGSLPACPTLIRQGFADAGAYVFAERPSGATGTHPSEPSRRPGAVDLTNV